jgi:hypothetical protein
MDPPEEGAYVAPLWRCKWCDAQRDGEPPFVTAIPRSLLESGGLRYYIRARDRMSQDSFSEVYDVEFDEPSCLTPSSQLSWL